MTVWTPTDDGHADLTDHDTFVQGSPHNTFARMRRDEPIAWTEYPAGKGFWSITRHADIAEMNRLGTIFSSAQGIRMEDQTYEEYLARRTFQETDAPEHTTVRKKLMKAFSRPVMAGFEDDIRELSLEIMDKALPEGRFDATKLIARELPMRMLGRIIGVPESDLPWLVEKGDALIANTDPDFTDHVLDKLETDAYRLMPFNSPAGAELYDYAREMMAEKERKGDTDGVLNLILQPDAEGNTISESEFRNFFCLVVAAGNDTTRYSIAAGMQAMAHQPELLGQIQRGDVTDTMADEIVRWAAPATYFRRTLSEDYTAHGVTMQKGDKVLFWWASANRDEAVFEDPMRVNLGRTPNPHMSFGQGGPHVCLGMHLARIEIRVLFEELGKRITSIEPDGDHMFLRSNFVGGIKSLPVNVTMA